MAKAQNSEFVAKVLLEAYDESRKKILDISIPVDDYYSDSHPLIDDSEYRKQKGIRIIQGQIYNYEGKRDQEFKNEYDSEGTYLRSRIVHADGTIIED